MYIIALLFSGDCSHHSDCNYMASLTLYILPVLGGFTLRKFAYIGNECHLQGANVIKHLGSPYQAKGFHWDMLCSMSSIVIVDTGIYFQTLKRKPLSEENIRRQHLFKQI